MVFSTISFTPISFLTFDLIFHFLITIFVCRCSERKKVSQNIINDKNEEIILTNNNKENIDVKIEPQVNNNTNNENMIIGDYLITIQYTKFFSIPYFIFGNMINFYCPCHKFKSKIINLSNMPTPPFGIITSECK